MNVIENVLLQLEQVRKSGQGFASRCPAHADRGPSLSIKEGDDGRVLMHCFAGCATADVVAAIGMTIANLFPPPDRPRPPPPAPGVTRTALRAAAEFERQVLAIVRFDRRAGRQISASDLQREQLAKQRLNQARKALT
ncbi:CHC2 zinc finger domain-containing protein [Variovorax arabinosiphilus]|uniref:CHC2 zinc finger domain-containing protein n=1 Tax=Variovorax arabinosiphilus TaxID=3053498 RepID=UPI002575231C|nr:MULTISPECIES: CHC2 zinc finger domain-containing protein [unclassified Variovorax]MDM0118905.1 CHC2 zinc finger domain-containing protein [Variovorax sp. J2L1-78]MDM0129330.1 CHC2 zinc finger domain-containing protein [Variovorax sp. J2L1-63]MDM0232883.1 CHC2 zinc finger domain-containing protein [Variovorax sp. J2R1-6]